MPGPYKPRPAGSLKAAVSALITEAGGLQRCADLVGRGTSQIARWGDPAEPDQMPVGVVLALEAAVGRPVVSGWLVAELGGAVMPMGAAEAGATGGGGVHAASARMAAEQSDYFAKLSVAVADGRIDPAEAGRLLEALDHQVAEAMACRASLQAIRDRVGEGGA